MQNAVVIIIGVVTLIFVVRGVMRAFGSGDAGCCGCDADCKNCSVEGREDCATRNRNDL